MGVSLEGMEHLAFFFFSEVEKRKISKKKTDMTNKEKKKQIGGTPKRVKKTRIFD